MDLFHHSLKYQPALSVLSLPPSPVFIYKDWREIGNVGVGDRQAIRASAVKLRISTREIAEMSAVGEKLFIWTSLCTVKNK